MREKSLRQDKHAKLGKRYKQKKFISSCCNQGVNIGNVPRNSFIVCSGMMELPLNCLYIFFFNNSFIRSVIFLSLFVWLIVVLGQANTTASTKKSVKQPAANFSCLIHAVVVSSSI